MAGKPLKFGIVGGVLVLALLYSGIGYFTGAVPFPAQKRGDIAASGMCESLGDGKEAAAALEKVLPTRGDYSTEDDNPPRSSDDTSWQANCNVYGDGDGLLYANSELATYGSYKGPGDDPRDDSGDGGSSHTFRAGQTALVTERTAEILVPCVSAGEMPGGAYQLSVVVHAQQPLTASADGNRHALAALALGTARYTHERAICSAPSKLPAKVTGLR